MTYSEEETIQHKYFNRRNRLGLNFFGAVAVTGLAFLYLALTY